MRFVEVFRERLYSKSCSNARFVLTNYTSSEGPWKLLSWIKIMAKVLEKDGSTLPETNIAPKMMVSNRNLLFQGSIFRGYVSFREGIRNCRTFFIFRVGFSTHFRHVFISRGAAQFGRMRRCCLVTIGNSRPQTERMYEKVVNSRESFHNFPNMTWNFRLVHCKMIGPSDNGLTRSFMGRNIENSQGSGLNSKTLEICWVECFEHTPRDPWGFTTQSPHELL